MTRNARTLVVLLSAATLTAGCASPAAERPAAASIDDCSQIYAEISTALQAKREALEKQQAAWKAVLPFAVAARHASGESAAADADKRLGQLRSELARRNCAASI